MGNDTFPVARVRLLIRFDEFAATDTPALPAKPPQLRTGDKAPALLVTPRDGRLVIDQQAGSPQDQTSSNDGRTWPVDLVPKSVTVERNGVRVADTATIELKFIDFPVDPRLVRSCAVQIYMGTLSEQEFRDGSVLPEESSGRSNLRFSGWVDEYRLELPEDGQPTVTIECTDNTRLLLDQKAPPQLKVKSSAPIDKAIADYLAEFPQFAGLEVEYRPAGQPVPVLDAALMPSMGGAQAEDTLTDGTRAKGTPPAGGGNESVWDYLTDCCGMVGCVVRVEGVRVVVQLPRTLYAQGFRGREDDPFQGRTLPDGRHLAARLLRYGQDVLSLQFAKKFARTVSSNVEVRCYSPRQKKTLVARHPPRAETNKKLSPGNAADSTYTVYRLQGIESEKVLRQVAQSVYESLNRGELEVTVITHDMSSVGGGSLDPDLLDLEAADQLLVEVPDARGGPSPGGTEESAEQARATRAAARLRELGFSSGFCNAYAAAAKNLYYATNFYVRTATLGWHEDSGFEFTATAINYVEARVDKELPPGEEPDPAAAEGATAATQPVQGPV